MPLDSSIPLQVQQPQMPDMGNQLLKILQIKGLQDESALNAIKTQAAQRDFENENALNQAYKGSLGSDGSVDRNALLRALADRNLGSKIPAVQKSFLENDKTQSEVGKNNALTAKDTSEAENKTIAVYRDASQSITDPQSAIAFVTHMHSDPRLANSAIARIPLDQAIAQIPQDPAQLGAWKQQFALGATKFMELNKPTTNVVNTGGSTQLVQTPGLGGAPTVAGTFQNTQSPDNAATNATHLQGINIQQAGENARNKATIAKDYTIAGINQDGSANGNVEQMAQAIAAGKAAPITGFALAKPQGQTVMRRVFEINPQYDETTYSAKSAAAKAFTSGQQGNALRSVATANAHLDQMGELVDALNNGNVNIINKVANAYAAQTGQPAPTNFDAVKNVIGQEVVKAIVAGGGSAGERDEAAAAFSNARSPQQLKGAIQHYRMIMGAQQANLLEQRRAAGLTDDTLPSYSRPSGGGSPASGMPSASAIDAELASRAGKK